jgi:putative membrane protein
MMGGIGGFGGIGIVGALLNLVITGGVIVGLVLLVLWVVRRPSSNESVGQALTGQPQPDQSPREILMQRYARGEIDREQYQTMLADLS